MTPDVSLLTPDHQNYPPVLRTADGDRWTRLWVLGDVGLLQEKYLGLFCSSRCPGDVILQAYDVARALRDAGVPVIGGFHTPMEQECQDLLLRGTQPVVWCPARGLPNPRRLSAPRREALAEGRLLVLSPFSGQEKRMTTQLGEQRNELVLRLAHSLLFLYAPPGSKTEGLCKKAMCAKKAVLTLEGEHCSNLVDLGAEPVRLTQLKIKLAQEPPP